MKFIDRKFYSMLGTSTFFKMATFILLLSDTVIAGQFFGEDAIAGVNLVLPLLSIVAFITTVIGNGSAINYSYEIGKFQKERAHAFFGQGAILSICSGVILLFLIMFGEGLYFHYLNSSVEVFNYASDYYTFYPYIALAYSIFGILMNMVYTDGDGTVSNFALIALIVGNIISSILLCKFMGIKGIALGTLIALVLASLVFMLHFLRKVNSLKFRFHIQFRDILQIAKFGSTGAGQFLCSALLLYGLNRFVISCFGSPMLPVLSVVISVINLTIVFAGIGLAISPLISVYRGEKNNLGIRNIMRTAQRTAIAEGLVFTILLLIFANIVPSLFGVTAPEIVAQSATAVRILAVTLVFVSLKYLYSYYYLYIEQIGLSIAMTLVSDLIGTLAIGIPLSILFGINGIWIGFAVAPLAALIFGAVYIIVRRGKDEFPLMLSKKDDTKVFTFDLTLTKENIMKLRNDIESLLKKNEISENLIFRIMLMIEEMCTLILQKNTKKTVYMESTVMLSGNVRLIFRDNGIIFNITDTDMKVSSLNAYVVSGIMERQKIKHYLTTMGYNRNDFCFDNAENA